MGQLINGRWHPAPDGENLIHLSGQGQFRTTTIEQTPGRYALCVADPCPWSQQCTITLALGSAVPALSVHVAAPLPTADGWQFSADQHPLPESGGPSLHTLYTLGEPAYSGRATLPLLFDRHHNRIVCNESADLVRILAGLAGISPASDRQTDIDALSTMVRDGVCGEICKAAHADSQQDHHAACDTLFAALGYLETLLADRTYLCGAEITEPDVILFPFLIRFDAICHPLFRCTLRRLRDCPNLLRYTRTLMALPAFRDTSRMEESKLCFWRAMRRLNPDGIVPLGPQPAPGLA